jgi:ATP-binding cassette subfamily C protein
MMGVLEFIRGRVMGAVLSRAVDPAERTRPPTAAQDVETIRQPLAGPAPFALFEIPWTPLFLAVIFLFHPPLGWIAAAGGATLIMLTVVNQFRSATRQSRQRSAAARRQP